MSLTLVHTDGKPEVKTHSGIRRNGFLDNSIRIGDMYIDVSDFCEAVKYFMINTDLDGKNDVRVQLKHDICSMKIINGYNGDNMRYGMAWEEKE